MWKDFFFFSKGERNGLVILSCLILLMFIINLCIPTQGRCQQAEAFHQREADSLVTQTSDSLLLHRGYVSSTWGKEKNMRKEYDKETANHEGTAITKVRQKWQRGQNREKDDDYESLRIELNSADTTELKKLRGIGSKLSQRIVKYRNKIGGYHSVEELKAIYGLQEETYQQIAPHLWIDTSVFYPRAGKEGKSGNQESVSSSGGSDKSSS